MSQRKGRPFLAFVGTHVRVVTATTAEQAREKVIADYAGRGFRLWPDEVSVRPARRSDLAWMRSAGANSIAERLDPRVP